jgi:hypothetical protein
MHQGSGNAHKLLVLDEGITYAPMGIPPEDAQFLETRRFQVVEIARLYRLPPHMLADLDRATFANIEHMSLEFLIYTLSPWLEKWEQEINRKLFMPGDGLYAQFDERRLMRGDLAARKDYYATARQWGWMSANDVLREEGMNPIGPDGDKYLSPMNMIPPDQVGKDKPKPTPPAPPPDANRFATAMRGVFEDAVGRMLRKESNAVTRAGDKPEKVEKFYAEHRGHVFDSLLPACLSLAGAIGIEEPAARASVTPILWAFAARRHDPASVNAMVPTATDDIIEQVTRAMKGQNP